MMADLSSFMQHFRIVVTIWLVAAMGGASAETPAEQRLSTAPMPHEALDARVTQVKVHLVRLQGYLEGRPANAIRLAELKEQVKACVAEHQRIGAQTQAPHQWPDFLNSMREDIYFAANRSIRYASGIAYVVNYSDCSLLEGASSTATIVSANGTCAIDLVDKTARGACSSPAKVPNIPSLPRRMPAGSQVQAAGTKIILGLTCDVWRQPALGDGATICLAKGGSFTPARMAGNTAEAGMPLEYESATGVNMRAVDAKFDAEVNARVFEPHLSSGFRVSGTGFRK